MYAVREWSQWPGNHAAYGTPRPNYKVSCNDVRYR
jgi:hypothetical protein